MNQVDPPNRHSPEALPVGTSIRQALPSDADAIHVLMRPFVMRRLLLSRTEAEIIELTRHGFVAVASGNNQAVQIVGFSAIKVYSTKLAELQCLAVHPHFQGSGVGRALVEHCVERAKALKVMEILAISSSEAFLKNCGFDYALPDQKKALFCNLRSRSHD